MSQTNRQLRVGVFETNSSSTHSITICSPEDLILLKMNAHTNEELQEDFNECNSSYSEYYCENYTTPKGEKIVIFGNYGYDG